MKQIHEVLRVGFKPGTWVFEVQHPNYSATKLLKKPKKEKGEGINEASIASAFLSYYSNVCSVPQLVLAP